jgi:hypothetical protein
MPLPSSHVRSHWIVAECGAPGVRRRVHVEEHVAVAALPRRDGVAVDRVHVDVDGEQVVAALGALLEHVVEEVVPVQPLAL